MIHHVYIISDLHLGGAPGADGQPGFQICPPQTQLTMAAFLDRLPANPADTDCHLVIAGDIVDFLAEEPFESFTMDPQVALTKFQNIVKHTAPVWAALRRFVGERGGALTLMLGNHDIELSLPATRQALLNEVGPGRVNFIYDNEAFVLGPLLVEHGNRFDAWNAVPHGALRRVRSQLSRRLPATPNFPALPGSRLVVDVMNPLKKDYPFIDLLKPEDAGALPIAAALGAGGLTDIWKFFGNYRRQHAVDYDESQEPLDPELIASAPNEDQAMYDAARDIAAGGDATQIGFVGDLLAGARDAIDEKKRQLRRDALFKAFEKTLSKHTDTFDTGREEAVYLRAAQRSAKAGFKAVVYGHTHLAKRIAIGADSQSVYLNSGTWADLMRVPPAVWSVDKAAGRKAMEAFVDDLENSRLGAWRRSCPTYARVDLEGDTLLGANVYFGDDDSVVSTESLLKRLAKGS
jgi:UDP-2,3-diacylglucosamine pyrophosphatase LpxH